ncbi:MAG: hypothetical protein E6J41_15300 [Chloroflexi bacterium]|nr:MAG: hypothetical protein E6J41_15300 [Chloroflexota bacterium]
MGLKDDVDFARFLSMGAVGAAAVARDLRERFGHQPIELERYSMANKVWQTKVKRLRIPDLVCVRCGTRIESRGKSKLEVRLSDSTSENREWHAGGMRPDDIFAFVRVDVGAATPVVGIPAYFTHASLQAAIDYAKKGIRKAASEGSELDISWPTWVPTRDGEFVEVRNKEIFYLPLVGGVKKYWQSRNWPQVHAYLARGEAFRAGDSIVAGVMPPSTIVRCQTSWDLARDLDSADGSDRYAAIKAAGALQVRELRERLMAIAYGDDDWRIRLEALVSLARIDPGAWVEEIVSFPAAVSGDETVQMESVLALSEIPTITAADALVEAAESRDGRPDEVRAAAVWGLGTGTQADPSRLVRFTTDSTDVVAVHAAAALRALPDDVLTTLYRMLHSEDERAAAVAAQVLARHRQIDLLIEASCEVGPARLWAVRALGDIPPDVVMAAARDLPTSLRESLEPIWIQHRDWLRVEALGPLDALYAQQVRYDPITATQDAPGAGL